MRKNRKILTSDPLEADIQKTIVAYLKLKKIEVTVTDASRVWGRDGKPRKSRVDPDHPDLSCVLPVVVNNSDSVNKLGLAFFIEVKTKTGSIRDGQKEKLRHLANAGALCMLARDVTEVVRVVELFLNKPFDISAYNAEIELLNLNLSDRRSKATRDALSTLKQSHKPLKQPQESLKRQ
jgi:hypothetical protein